MSIIFRLRESFLKMCIRTAIDCALNSYFSGFFLLRMIQKFSFVFLGGGTYLFAIYASFLCEKRTIFIQFLDIMSRTQALSCEVVVYQASDVPTLFKKLFLIDLGHSKLFIFIFVNL